MGNIGLTLSLELLNRIDEHIKNKYPRIKNRTQLFEIAVIEFLEREE
ncbi:hypothetical protein GOV10_03680 [Candidatus Woesearchaeota archaeon]|nr:hypothetical protein [Candidatus Woesearchaeota archaeon]